MKSKKKMAKNICLYTLLILLIVCFISIYYYVINNNGLYDFTPIDRTVYDYVISNVLIDKNIFIYISYFGKEIIIGFSLILILFNLIYMKFKNIENKKLYLANTIMPAVAALGVYLLNDVFKNCVQRYRPLVSTIVTERSYSFPSGHSATSAAFYFMLLIIICKLLNNYIDNNNDRKRIIFAKVLKIISLIIIPLMPFLIAFARIALGVHYFTDVVCGLIFGSIIFIILYKIY